jgi:hypothetical protein
MEKLRRLMEAIDPLLETLSERLGQVKAGREERARIEAPEFDPLVYMQLDEVGLSWMLADLLDPRGAHAQGDLFLRQFIESVGLGELANLQRAQVVLESVTVALDRARRIDILIHGEDWVIGIENKPWAIDQPRQVIDYLVELRNCGTSRFHLLYLTRDGSRPSTNSIAESDCETAIQSQHLIMLSYATVAEWLAVCARRCEADRVSWFLKTLQRHVEQSLVGRRSNAGEEQVIMDTVFDRSNPGHLSSALEIIQSRDAIRKELRKRLMLAVKARLPDGWSIYRDLTVHPDLGLKMPGSAGWHFCVEPQRKGISDWCYGIKFDAEDVGEKERRRIVQLGKALRTVLPGVGQESDWWPYWRWFRGLGEHEPKEYADWELSVQPWIDMDNGKMADHFVSLAERIYAVLPTSKT